MRVNDMKEQSDLNNVTKYTDDFMYHLDLKRNKNWNIKSSHGFCFALDNLFVSAHAVVPCRGLRRSF